MTYSVAKRIFVTIELIERIYGGIMKKVLLLSVLLVSLSLFADWTIVGTYTIPGKASGLAFDGTYLYSGIYGSNGDQIWQIDPVTGTYQLQFSDPDLGDTFGLTYDGTNLWLTDHHTGSANPAIAYQYDMNGSVISQFDLPDHYMSGIAYDAGNFWVSTYYPDPGVIYEVDATGAVLQQFTPPATQAWDLCVENANLWVTDYNANTIYQMDKTTGAILDSHPCENIKPAGIVFDGTYLWYVDGGLSSPSTLYKVDLGGTGTPAIQLPYTTYDFGNVVINAPLSTQLPITNTGTADLIVNDFTFTNSAFVSATTFPITIAPGATTQFDVTFDPTLWGPYTSLLTVHSNDPVHPAEEIDLTGYAINDNPTIIPTLTSLSFGSVRVNASHGQSTIISNQGLQSLVISDITFSDPAFSLDASIQLPLTLSSREEQNVRIWFIPTASGTYNETATISSNDPATPAVTIDLSGSAVESETPLGDQLWYYSITTGYDHSPKAMDSIADVSGDGVDDVIVCSEDHHVRCLNGNSSGAADVLWSFDISSGSVYKSSGLSIIEDINNDGYQDVIVGTTGGDRSIRAISGLDGTSLWQFNTNLFGDGGWVYAVFSSYDYNGDENPDVLAATGDDSNGNGPKRIFCLDGTNGTMLWNQYTGGTSFSVIGIRDINADGTPDVLAGTTNEDETQGYAKALNGTNGSELWSTEVSGSSCWALAQLDDFTGDSVSDVVVGDFGMSGNGPYYGLDATTGDIQWSGSVGGSIVLELIPLDDVNADGYIDFTSAHSGNFISVVSGYDGTTLWSYSVADKPWCVDAANDITGDGINDIVVGTLYQSNFVYFFDGAMGTELWSTNYGEPIDALCAIPDVTADGSWEMVAGGRSGNLSCYSGGPVVPITPGVIEGTITLDGGSGDVTEVEVSAGNITVHPSASGAYSITINPGTYQVIASLASYESAIQNGVVVEEGQTTGGIDLTLVYITPYLMPPSNVAVDEATGLVTWEAPGAASGVLSYHNGYDANGIGTGSAVDFECAARFTADELIDLYGSNITAMKLVIHSADFSQVTAKIWEGGSYGDPGTVVYSADITNEINVADWTEHVLSTPVPLVPGSEYWIGYAISATGDHPAAVDAGPMVADKGAWMYFNGTWDVLTNLGATLDFNWCIEGIVGDGATTVSLASAPSIQKKPVQKRTTVLCTDPLSAARPSTTSGIARQNRDLTGYNIYLDGTLIVSNIPDTEYQLSGLITGQIYTVGVSAVYDEGESEIIEVTCVAPSSANNGITSVTSLLGNYPNPFNPTTKISYSLKTSGPCILHVYNIKGEKVRTLVDEDQQAGLHFSLWNGTDDTGRPVSSGVYFYRLNAGNYTASRKMILMK